ncbi:MAG: MBOAT family O-acyltransferase, partial [Muribaculaceae bacterium]
MIFNSFSFLYIFPAVFVIYYGLRALIKSRQAANALLLITSYALYAWTSPVWCLFLLLVTASTYLAARFIESRNAYGKRSYITISLIISLLPLIVFKYYNFLQVNITDLFASLGMHIGLPGLNWAIPLGISFYTFQAVGYLFDVYYQRIRAEHNWWHYMLFVGFFPQIVAGPISKAGDLLPQIKAQRPFDYAKCVQGLRWMLWGAFLKIVIADRLGMYVDTVYGNYECMSGMSCLVAAVLYSIQIYT